MAKTKQPQGPSLIIKRTVKVAGRRSSVSLEDAFWKGLKKIAATKGLTLQDLISKIDKERQHANLSSAIRLFVLDYYRATSAARQSEAGRESRMARATASALRSE